MRANAVRCPAGRGSKSQRHTRGRAQRQARRGRRAWAGAHLERGELVADALALAAAEGDEGKVGGRLARVEARALGRVVSGPSLDLRICARALPPLRVKGVRLVPDLRAQRGGV